MSTNNVLVLRTCNSDMTAHGGFVWPTEGFVEAPDFINNTECGNGLHGLLWGHGDMSYLSSDADAKWLLVEVLAEDIIRFGETGATSGYEAHASTSGDWAHASTSGNKSIACSLGLSSKVKAGESGALILTSWDSNEERYRVHVAYVGEKGIKPNTWYTLNDDNEFIECED